MPRIVSILRAAHCRSTHHYFAIDALRLVQTVQGKRLTNLLLKYYDDYLIGAKAPDTTFHDFQNHVIHVSDNHWGGAPKKCEEWLQRALNHLDRRQWKKAAYACGVLSHYFTDPLMPLHTAQSEKESAIHRPMEWSVCKSYDAIAQQISDDKIQAQFQLAGGEHWVSRAVLAGASVAHEHYDRLIEIYDLARGCKNPPEGLNAEARQILAELFAIATTGWAQILTRIADESTVEIPDVSLRLTTLLASIDMPLAWIAKKISDISEQRAVAKIFREYKSKGTIRRTLPQEVKTVSYEKAKSFAPKLTAGDMAKPRLAVSAKNSEEEQLLVSRPAFPPNENKQISDFPSFASPQTVISTEQFDAHRDVPPLDEPLVSFTTRALPRVPVIAEPAPKDSTISSGPSRPVAEVDACHICAEARVPTDAEPSPSRSRGQDAPRSKLDTTEDEKTVSVWTEEVAKTSLPNETFLPFAPSPNPATDSRDAEKEVEETPGVSLASNLVDSPSIGPKTARRFARIGIHTIIQFVSADVQTMVKQLDARWMTTDLLREWQDQARLVCDVPALCGYKAQLLVAVDCRTSAKLASSNPQQLAQAIFELSQTAEGERILRSSRVPIEADVTAWITSAAAHANRRAG